MSLRRRFLAVFLVACVALGAAVAGVLALLARGAAAREAAAREQSLRAMGALAHLLERSPGALDAATPDGRALTASLAEIVAPVRDGTVGYCTREGVVLAQRSAIPDGRAGALPHVELPRLDGMLPLDRNVVADACRRAARVPTEVRFEAPIDLLFVATLAVPVATRREPAPEPPTAPAPEQADAVAFALVRTPKPAEDASVGGALVLAVIVASVLVLLGLTSHAILVLRRSTESLEASLALLETDLRAEVREPGAVELGRVAARLGKLAARLADAQDRERDMAAQVEEQRRLASLGRVVAGVAHEVRNPLAGIKLRLDGMARRALDERSALDVSRCLREVERLDRLVRSLLLVSRRRDLTRAPLDVAALVDERLGLAEADAGPRGVHLVREGEATLDGDREELARLLDNLVKNGIEASPRGATVTVRMTSDAQTATIDVIDQGEGIPDERAHELFEPFFTTKGGGTGLGLVLSRAVAEAHGGTLRYGRVGATTHFTLAVPRAAPEGEPS